MIIYTKLPIADIKYTDRPEFHKEEIKFKTALMNSIKKHGIIDPVYAEVGNDYGRYIKVIVGNNRMAVAKELGIPRLKEEQSASASIGFTATLPESNIKIVVDGYFIAIEDRVTVTDTFDASSPELVAAFERANATKASFFSNAIDTESRG